MTAKTGWKCERCGNARSVPHDDGADVYTIVHLIEDDHAAESEGRCALDLGKLRVWPIPPPAQGEG